LIFKRRGISTAHRGFSRPSSRKAGAQVEVQVEGQLVFITIALRMNVVLGGFGLGEPPECQVQAYLVDRRLVWALCA
jgi:hypothetical protein